MKQGHWVQTERAAHEAWAALMRKSVPAAQIMHLLTARVGEHNAVVISQKTLADLAGYHVNTIKTALKVLAADNWIEVRRVGESGTVNAYVLNDRVVWSGPRDGIRYSLFSAAVIVSSAEQPDAPELDELAPLRTVPALRAPGERQLPSGDGLPPPSQPDLPTLEPDLPAIPPQQLDNEDLTGPPPGRRKLPTQTVEALRAAGVKPRVKR